LSDIVEVRAFARVVAQLGGSPSGVVDEGEEARMVSGRAQMRGEVSERVAIVVVPAVSAG
jgi:hypothetical protein